MITLERVEVTEKRKDHSIGVKITPNMNENHPKKRVILPKRSEHYITEG